MVTATRLNKTELKTQLRHILLRHMGRASAITGESLSRQVGQRNRQVRQLLEDLIDEGLPIVSTSEPPAGYFIPTSLAEAKEYTESLRTRALTLFIRSRKVRRNTGLFLTAGPASQGRLL